MMKVWRLGYIQQSACQALFREPCRTFYKKKGNELMRVDLNITGICITFISKRLYWTHII